MAQAALQQDKTINGFSPLALRDVVEHITEDPRAAVAGFRVRSEWKGGAQVESRVSEYELGGQKIARRHVIASDEPRELFGTDSAPNPQELLFAALNACMIFGFTAKAAVLGIGIDSLSIETHGQLDIRGAFGLGDVPPGMPTMNYTVRIRSRATDAQLAELHEAVMANSPNRFHLTRPIELVPSLVIER